MTDQRQSTPSYGARLYDLLWLNPIVTGSRAEEREKRDVRSTHQCPPVPDDIHPNGISGHAGLRHRP